MAAKDERRGSEPLARNPFHLLADSVPVVLWVCGPDKSCTFVNQVWRDYTGRTLAEEQGIGWSESVHPNDRARTLAVYGRAFDAREPCRIEYRLRRADGSYRWFLSTGAPFYSRSDARFLGYVGTAVDIHERRELEASLRASEDRFRALYEDNPSMFFTMDASGTILSVNRFGAAQLGYLPEDLVGTPVSTVVHPADRARAGELLELAFKLPGQISHWEFRKVRKDGSELLVHETVRLVEGSPGERVALVVCEDVTRHQELEAQLRQAHKMEAIGRLAGSIAHDFNNLLTVIAGYAEILVQAELPEVHRTPVLEIQRASERATALTRQLLAFGKKQVLRLRRLDPETVVRELEPMLSRLIGTNVRLRFQLAPAGEVLADQAQLEQVVINLVLNARDAMPEGGEIEVATRPVRLYAEDARGVGLTAEGEYVLLEVRDSGCGMDEETRSRVFEPFFTTKGGGTGLGLASVYGIARQCGGAVTVASTPGRGALFGVYLPCAVPQPEPTAVLQPAPAGGLAAGRGTVLLVEDESGVRELLASTLRSAGYQVLEAANAREADFLLASHAGRLDLVLTDLIMPGESGYSLARRLSAARPGLKVVCMSGYPGESLSSDPGTADYTLVPKPFSLAHLTRILGRV